MIAQQQPSRGRAMVVGSGWRFTSGISHYTYRLSEALAAQYSVSVLLMRGLVPKRLYPGASRVGADVNDAAYSAHIPIYDGVDWYWGRSLTGALKFIDQQRPDVVIFQWWTGAVLHTYLRLARYAARRGVRVILEWHEGQDVGEATLVGARQYVSTLMPRLLSYVDAHVVHSACDLDAITSAYSLGDARVCVIPHGPYDHLVQPTAVSPGSADQPFQLLSFGVVRPFKGVEDLVEAFSALDRDQAARFRLTVVGETWEGWTAPNEAIGRSPHADLIERVDRYVTDAELADYFARADAVVLPYHRSSASGPLHVAMSAGLPVLATAVGGLIEAVRDYPGALLVPPKDPVALRGALLGLLERRGQRYSDPHSWNRTVSSLHSLIDELRQGESESGKIGDYSCLEDTDQRIQMAANGAGTETTSVRSRTEVSPPTALNRTVHVVIACYDVQRMSLLMRAVRSVCDQDYPHELTVVVDYNEDLYLLALSAAPENVSVIRNARSRGAAGARNMAALRSDCALVAFLDDDACARAGWLRSLVHAMDRPGVVGVGGRILPGWQHGCPRWFPPELGWVVGASIAAAGPEDFPVRNVWAGSMMVDRKAFQAVNGFREDLSKVGGAAQPEDTELCLRLSHAYGAAGQLLMVPSAVVEHHVPAHRANLRYVVDRCWSEGTGKVRMRAMAADRRRALADEKAYLSRTIPRAVAAGVLQSLRLRTPDGLMRAGTVLLGVGAAILGALTARIGAACARHDEGEPT